MLGTLIVATAYCSLFFPLLKFLGTAVLTLSWIPMALTAWNLGARSGLAAGILTVLLNAALLQIAGENPWDVLVRSSGGAAGSMMLILLGTAAGWVGDLYKGLRKELAARLEAEQRLRGSESQARLQSAALSAAANAIMITDREGTIQWVNPAWTQLTGYSAPEAIGKNPRFLKSGAQDQAFYSRLWDTILSGNVWRGEVVNKRKDGVLYPEEETITPLVDEEGAITHFIAIKQDISDRKRDEARIEGQVGKLQALREIDLAITASVDPRVTFSVLLRQVTDQLKVDAADILVFDSHSQTLDFSAGSGFRTEALQHTHLRIGEGLAGRAAAERDLVMISELSATAEIFEQSPQLAQEGFVSYYAVPLVAKGAIQGVLEIFHRERLEPDQEWLDFLDSLAGQAAIAIDNAMLFDGLIQSNSELRQAYDATLEGWARALELRDIETEGHSRRVTDLTVRLARKLGISGPELVNIRRGALLHDIGKMGIPDSILHKPDSLTEEEWSIMREHPRYAYDMLSSADYLRPALDIPYAHHEKWDGSGYPRGLAGKEIPRSARIFAIADVWDALRSDRPYRKAWTDMEALEYIRSESGTHFDPEIVSVFLDLLQASSGPRTSEDRNNDLSGAALLPPVSSPFSPQFVFSGRRTRH